MSKLVTMDKTTKDKLRSQIEILFKSIVNPSEFEKEKETFLDKWNSVYFIFKKNAKLKLRINPVLKFRNIETLKSFLEQEKKMAVKFQEYENAQQISNMISDLTDMTPNYFQLDYEIESADNEIRIYFNTNSFLFKYNILGN